MLPVPLFHLTGCMGGLARCVAVGFKLVLMRRWDADTCIDLMIKEKVTGSVGVPSIFQGILQSRNLTDKIKLTAVTVGGAQPPERLPSDVRKAWPDAYMLAAFGMTETTGAHVTLSGPDLFNKVILASMAKAKAKLTLSLTQLGSACRQARCA